MRVCVNKHASIPVMRMHACMCQNGDTRVP